MSWKPWVVQRLVSKGDYTYAVVPGHPHATKNGYVLEHRIVMENHLGRLLTEMEIVHHDNEDKKDNRVSNLVLSSNVEHSRMHALKQGRQMCRLQCPACKATFTIPRNQSFLAKKTRYTCCSKRCRGIFSHKVRKPELAGEVQEAIDQNLIEEFVQLSS